MGPDDRRGAAQRGARGGGVSASAALDNDIFGAQKISVYADEVMLTRDQADRSRAASCIREHTCNLSKIVLS